MTKLPFAGCRYRAQPSFSRSPVAERTRRRLPAPRGKDSGTYYMVGIQYNINQQLWLIRLAEQDEGGVTRTFAREYRYDGDGRVRYYERDRDPDNLEPIGATAEKWREFLGSSVYADLDVLGTSDPLSSQKSRRYVHAADGQLVAWFDVPDSEHPSGQWHFVHADMLGTTRLVTDDAGNVGSGLAYTAFGELTGSAFPGGPAATSRYGYCGGWGYEDDTLATLGGGSDPVAGLDLLHVGARWYAPGLGRFVQRDPISIDGGFNPFAYALNSPSGLIDRDGHTPGAVTIAFGFEVGYLSGFSAAIAMFGSAKSKTANIVALWGGFGQTLIVGCIAELTARKLVKLSRQTTLGPEGVSLIFGLAGFHIGLLEGAIASLF